MLKDSTAFLLTQAMMDVMKSGGTASDVSIGEMPIAGKTGTTSDDRDIWLAGYSPYYTCSVWGGYDNHDTLPSGDIYHTYHKKLWTAIMSRIHENLPVKQFEQPDSVETAYVCKNPGCSPLMVSATRIRAVLWLTLNILPGELHQPKAVMYM